MCIRKMYRGFNIGKYLLNSLIKNPNYVGIYDAIVTSSDVYATKFYEKYGFNFDHILNSKYANIGDIWTNTTKMCYLPTYNLTIDTDYTKIYVQPFEFYIENKNQSDLLNEREKSNKQKLTIPNIKENDKKNSLFGKLIIKNSINLRINLVKKK